MSGHKKMWRQRQKTEGKPDVTVPELSFSSTTQDKLFFLIRTPWLRCRTTGLAVLIRWLYCRARWRTLLFALSTSSGWLDSSLGVSPSASAFSWVTRGTGALRTTASSPNTFRVSFRLPGRFTTEALCLRGDGLVDSSVMVLRSDAPLSRSQLLLGVLFVSERPSLIALELFEASRDRSRPLSSLWDLVICCSIACQILIISDEGLNSSSSDGLSCMLWDLDLSLELKAESSRSVLLWSDFKESKELLDTMWPRVSEGNAEFTSDEGSRPEDEVEGFVWTLSSFGMLLSRLTELLTSPVGMYVRLSLRCRLKVASWFPAFS